ISSPGVPFPVTLVSPDPGLFTVGLWASLSRTVSFACIPAFPFVWGMILISSLGSNGRSALISKSPS
ncbi:hypothetical protein PT041_08930, partial [Erysipelothrix rhusiopathiae]|nr:hypothetical protein [Erysipelothrix rhusiopathiae]